MRVACHPFTDIAIKIGNIKVANMVALGSYIAKKKTVSLKTALRVIEEMGLKAGKDLMRINQEALQEGARLT